MQKLWKRYVKLQAKNHNYLVNLSSHGFNNGFLIDLLSGAPRFTPTTLNEEDMESDMEDSKEQHEKVKSEKQSGSMKTNISENEESIDEEEDDDDDSSLCSFFSSSCSSSESETEMETQNPVLQVDVSNTNPELDSSNLELDVKKWDFDETSGIASLSISDESPTSLSSSSPLPSPESSLQLPTNELAAHFHVLSSQLSNLPPKPTTAALKARRYLEALIWILDMYITGRCQNYYFLYGARYAPDGWDIIDYLKSKGPVEVSRESYEPMRPCVCAAMVSFFLSVLFLVATGQTLEIGMILCLNFFLIFYS